MTAELTLTLNITQLVLLGGLIWGLAKMSAAVDSLREVTNRLTDGLEGIGASLADMMGRVRVLEDRAQR